MRDLQVPVFVHRVTADHQPREEYGREQVEEQWPQQRNEPRYYPKQRERNDERDPDNQIFLEQTETVDDPLPAPARIYRSRFHLSSVLRSVFERRSKVTQSPIAGL